MTRRFKKHVAIMLAGLIFLGRGNSRVLADDGNTTDPNGNSAVTSKENDGDSKEKGWHEDAVRSRIYFRCILWLGWRSSNGYGRYKTRSRR